MLKSSKKIDIIMVVMFFALLFMPMSHISDAEKSEFENRMLAKKPQLTSDTDEYNKYGMLFDAWYNDHFFGREIMIRLHNKVMRINNILEDDNLHYDKRTRWIFHKAGYGLKSRDWQKQLILYSLEKLNNFAKSNGIKLYLFILPHKIDIYRKQHPLYKKGLGNLAGDYIDYVQKNVSFPIIYPLNELKKASKKDYVYFKRSHHWTEWGAYNGYVEIMKAVSKDFDNVRTLQDKDYTIFYDDKLRDDWERDFKMQNKVSMFDIEIGKEELKSEKYRYYNPIKEIIPKVTDVSEHKIKEFENTFADNDLKVVLTGTSNNENLLQFLPYSFRELKYYRWNSVKDLDPFDEYKLLKRYKKEILEFKPDILIVSIVADNVPVLYDLTNEN